MDIETIKRRARMNCFIGLGLLVMSAVLAMAEVATGNLLLLAITAACFVVLGVCVIVNVRIAVQ